MPRLGTLISAAARTVKHRFTRVAEAGAGELSSCRQERERLRGELHKAWLRHRPVELIGGTAATSHAAATPPDDLDLIRRIITAYRAAVETDVGTADSFWLQTIADLKRPIQETLLRGRPEEVADILRHPGRSMLFYGFDSLYATNLHDEQRIAWDSEWVYDNLLRLAEAIGVCRLFSPENTAAPSAPQEVETLLLALDRVFGFRIDFPTPFSGEVGLATSRGVASYRTVQALYQAWRITQTDCHRPDLRVVEIGAGLGRTAYYAHQLGVPDYTTVDLPLTGVAQAYFLGRVLGEENVQLYGEEPGQGVRIMPPAALFDSQECFHLAVNVDSLTEMAPQTARRYWQAIQERASAFLSINHEANTFTVRDLYEDSPGHQVTRFPYWMRHGYVEELVRFRKA